MGVLADEDELVPGLHPTVPMRVDRHVVATTQCDRRQPEAVREVQLPQGLWSRILRITDRSLAAVGR
jgi:hypothetical protein